MKENLINQSTYTRYKLDQIPDLNYTECIDALQLLNYLLRRAEPEEAQLEIKRFIDMINVRLDEVKSRGNYADEDETSAESDDEEEA